MSSPLLPPPPENFNHTHIGSPIKNYQVTTFSVIIHLSEICPRLAYLGTGHKVQGGGGGLA